MGLSYIPSPLSIYKNVFKLEPGHIIKFTNSVNPISTPYWSIEDKYALSKKTPFQGSENEAINELENIIKKTLTNQSIADVPLGTFLSGGIDSS